MAEGYQQFKIDNKIYIFLSILSLLLYACAQIVPLSGGEKDIDPPKELKSEPGNKSVNFTAKNIIIEFNEFIRLQHLSSQLIVSPLMEKTPEISVHGKKLIIKIESPLLPNTTYSINFGNAIVDITENNEIPNYKYVFSTGNYIDSLSISGNAVDAFNLKEQDKIYVLLYNKFNDSIPLQKLPRYVAITNKKGAFSITNVAQGKYKLFALKDINSNYIYDLPNEKIAFKTDTLVLDSSLTNNIIYLFNEDNDLQYLKKATNKVYGKLEFLFNLPTKKLTITANIKTDKNWFVKEKNKNKDKLTLWITDSNVLKNHKEIEFVIANSSTIIDTTRIALVQPKTFKETSLAIFTNINTSFDLNKNINLTTKRPVKTFFKDGIKLYEDSVLVPFKFIPKNKVLRTFIIKYNFKENTPYTLYIPPATFTGIYNLKNDTIIKTFITKKASDYGNIFLTIHPSFSQHYIIQLIKGSKIIKEDYDQGKTKINYNYLLPSNYKIKLIIDKNNNKKWDTGNYLKHQQPERVIFYEKPIKIRSNWDNEIIWKVNTKD